MNNGWEFLVQPTDRELRGPRANEFLPNVPARVEPLLARCWSKKSKPVYSNGRLVPWAA
jgi:hypothetical protein